jgi:predicted nucleic acid-binding protein
MLVFDASAAVKWFRPGEAGAELALNLLMNAEGADVWLPDNGVHEVMRCVAQRMSPEATAEAWDWLMRSHVSIGHIDRDLIAAATQVQAELGCTYYDALAPALAQLLGGTLVSADRKAHAAFPEVLLLG